MRQTTREAIVKANRLVQQVRAANAASPDFVDQAFRRLMMTGPAVEPEKSDDMIVNAVVKVTTRCSESLNSLADAMAKIAKNPAIPKATRVKAKIIQNHIEYADKAILDIGNGVF